MNKEIVKEIIEAFLKRERKIYEEIASGVGTKELKKTALEYASVIKLVESHVYLDGTLDSLIEELDCKETPVKKSKKKD